MEEKQEFLNAVKAGDETKVRDLLKANAGFAKVKDEKGVSAVLQAVYNGRDKIANILIATGIKLDIFEASAWRNKACPSASSDQSRVGQ